MRLHARWLRSACRRQHPGARHGPGRRGAMLAGLDHRPRRRGAFRPRARAVSPRRRGAGANGRRRLSRGRPRGKIDRRHPADVRHRADPVRPAAGHSHRAALPGAAPFVAGSRIAQSRRVVAIDGAAFPPAQGAQFRRHEMEEIPLSPGLRFGRVHLVPGAGLLRLRRFRLLFRLRGRRRADSAMSIAKSASDPSFGRMFSRHEKTRCANAAGFSFRSNVAARHSIPSSASRARAA